MKRFLTFVVVLLVVLGFSVSAVAQKTDRRVATFNSLLCNVRADFKPDKVHFQTALQNFNNIENLSKGKFLVMLISDKEHIAVVNFMFYKFTTDRNGPTWTTERDGSNAQPLPVDQRGGGLMVAQYELRATTAKATKTNNVFTVGNRNYIIF